ncbi:Transmembrane emp24 domain-containing protein p24delta9 [Sesamum angolense]|uniref:Transmembrane emp24 domain-containing protein p24delta9 n=1 Tax=Sesamum angolense TaxID=2727404 RepID=A0AAE1X1H1_9LAMI|nr:Transmembrane emp24 domain-containing protein p24delta9 [Sesamum angolense]
MNMQIQRQRLFVVLISVFLFWTRVQSVRFDLESGHTKCISEDIKSNSMTVGKYHIVNPNEGHPLPDSHRVTVRRLMIKLKAQRSLYLVVISYLEPGDYMACFFAADHKPPTSLTIDFDWKSGVAAKDWTNVAKKGRPGRSDHPNCLLVHKMGWVKEETWKVSKELLGPVVRMVCLIVA